MSIPPSGFSQPAFSAARSKPAPQPLSNIAQVRYREIDPNAKQHSNRILKLTAASTAWLIMGQKLAAQQKEEEQKRKQAIQQPPTPPVYITPQLLQPSLPVSNQPRFGDSSLFWILESSAQAKELKEKDEQLKQKNSIIQQQQALLAWFGYLYPPIVQQTPPTPKTVPQLW